MPDSRKQILGPFTGREKCKAWNKTRVKYMPVKRRQNLAETVRNQLVSPNKITEILEI